MVSRALSTPNRRRLFNKFDVSCTYNNIIELVPVLRSRVHPGCFVAILHAKKRVGDRKVEFGAQSEET